MLNFYFQTSEKKLLKILPSKYVKIMYKLPTRAE